MSSPSIYPELTGKVIAHVDWHPHSSDQAEILKVEFTDGTHMVVESQGYAYCTSGVSLELVDSKEEVKAV